MELWIPITILAAFLQNARSALQRHLKGRIGPIGATFVRFCYGLPFALGYLAVVAAVTEPPPAPTAWFFTATAIGGLAQILATAALLASFSHANFAVGTAFSKTEPVQAAIFGAILLAEAPTALVWIAIAIGAVGVFVATLRGEDGSLRINGRAAGLGLLSAALFGVSAVSYRAGSLSLPDGDVWIRAATTLAVATAMQTIGMGLWMARYAPEELRRTAAAWRPGLLVGACGAFASACWFTAMTLEPVAHVRALGQVEMIFTFIASIFFFRERPSAQETIGVALMIGGVVLLLLAAA